MTTKRKSKFNTHHFPVGTVFRIEGSEWMLKDGDTFTATGLVNNNLDSWIVLTTATREHTGQVAYNLDYVAEIIKRGDGPVKVESAHPTIMRKRMQEDVDMMELPPGFMGIVPGKRFYNTGSPRSVIHLELDKVTNPFQIVDTDRLVSAVMQQTWTHRYCEGFVHFTSIDKKKLRRFIKANLNRFLITRQCVKQCLKQEADDMDRIMNEELDREREKNNARAFRCEFPINQFDVFETKAKESNSIGLWVVKGGRDGNPELGQVLHYGENDLSEFWKAVDAQLGTDYYTDQTTSEYDYGDYDDRDYERLERTIAEEYGGDGQDAVDPLLSSEPAFDVASDAELSDNEAD